MPLCCVHIEGGHSLCISICRSALICVAVKHIERKVWKSGARKGDSLREGEITEETASRLSLVENVLNFPKCLSNLARFMLDC